MREPELVGILNITPDSFSGDGLHNQPKKVIIRAAQLFKDGASIIDIGAESTRPGATPLTHQQEWAKLEPVLSSLISKYTGAVSLDTYHPETVRLAAQVGPFIINDVSAFSNPAMREVAAELNCLCIASHIPSYAKQDIQKAHSGPQINSVQQVYDELLTRRDEMIASGIKKDNIILDPGIGFGKTVKLNWQLLTFASLVTDHKVMVGYSKKRFLGENRQDIETNVLAAQIAIKTGTKYLRVHDVAGHKLYLQSRK